jgi:hypothetical protein
MLVVAQKAFFPGSLRHFADRLPFAYPHAGDEDRGIVPTLDRQMALRPRLRRDATRRRKEPRQGAHFLYRPASHDSVRLPASGAVARLLSLVKATEQSRLHNNSKYFALNNGIANANSLWPNSSHATLQTTSPSATAVAVPTTTEGDRSAIIVPIA